MGCESRSSGGACPGVTPAGCTAAAEGATADGTIGTSKSGIAVSVGVLGRASGAARAACEQCRHRPRPRRRGRRGGSRWQHACGSAAPSRAVPTSWRRTRAACRRRRGGRRGRAPSTTPTSGFCRAERTRPRVPEGRRRVERASATELRAPRTLARKTRTCSTSAVSNSAASRHRSKGDPVGRNPLHTKLCDMLGIEFPIIAFTHCKDVVAAVVNAGGFAVLGEAMHTRGRDRRRHPVDPEPRRRQALRHRPRAPGLGARRRHAGAAARQDSGRAQALRRPHQGEVQRPRPEGPAGAAPVGRAQPGHRAEAARGDPRRARAGLRVRPRQPGLHAEGRARARHEGVRPDRQGAAGEARDRGRRRRHHRAGLRRRRAHRADRHVLDRARRSWRSPATRRWSRRAA